MWYVTVPLVALLVFLVYYMYTVITKKETTNNKQQQVESSLGYCTFEGEDLFKHRVYTLDGKRVSRRVSPVKCTDCNQYVYKNREGCASYVYDPLVNTGIDDSDSFDNFCDPAHPERDKDCVEPHGICTVSLSPSKKCPF